jgi:uncharacterized protein YggE
MRKMLGLSGLVLTLAFGAYGQNATTPPSLITVSGQAEVRVRPDEVVFTMGVDSVDKDMLTAKNRTDDAVRQVLSIAKANNIKPEDSQTSYISVQPKYNTDDLPYEQQRTTKREFLGYEVSKTIAVTLKDISRFDSLLSDVLKAGVTRLSNVAFRDSKIRQHKDEARAMAIKAAQEKAKLLASQIGQQIGPAYSITESGVVPYSPANVSQNRTLDAFIGGAAETESAIAPGTISVSAQVTVSFRLY